MTKKVKVKFIYMTASSLVEAENIAGILVEEKLVACANILGESTSIYRWEGKLAKETEVIIILKTASNLTKITLDRISELHSYECPAAVILNIQGGNAEFLNWINNAVDQSHGD